MAEDDIEYFEGRAALESELARTARDEAVAAVHAQLAKRYEQMARHAQVEELAQTIAVERSTDNRADPT